MEFDTSVLRWLSSGMLADISEELIASSIILITISTKLRGATSHILIAVRTPRAQLV